MFTSGDSDKSKLMLIAFSVRKTVNQLSLSHGKYPPKRTHVKEKSTPISYFPRDPEKKKKIIKSVYFWHGYLALVLILFLIIATGVRNCAAIYDR